MMWRTRLRKFIEMGAWERCLKSGELKSLKKKKKCVLNPKIAFFEQSLIICYLYKCFHFLNWSCEVDEGGSKEQFDGFYGEVDLPDIY